MADVKWREVLHSYVANCIALDKPVSVSSFILEEKDFILKHVHKGERIQAILPKRLQTITQELNVTLEKSNVDWGRLALEILEYRCDPPILYDQNETLSTTESASGSSSSSSSSKSQSTASVSGYRMTSNDLEALEMMYNSLEKDQMWMLKSGRRVEEVLYERAKATTLESPWHSMIIDPTDQGLNGWFTAEELEEIQETDTPALIQMPEDMQAFLDSFISKQTLDELRRQNDDFKFDRQKEADLYWMQKSITSALDLYEYNFFQDLSSLSENDLVRNVWGFIERCFDPSPIKVSGGEITSQASTERKNGAKSDAERTRKQMGTRIDLLFKANLLEFGVAEFGRSSDTLSMKNAREVSLKCPKTMKDMLVKLEKRCPNKLNQLKVQGMVIAGLNLNLLSMDCPRGYICRILPLGWQQYPVSVEEFISLIIPLFTTVYHAKRTMEQVRRDIIRDQSRRTTSFGKKSMTRLSPSFTPVPVPRKRKASNSM